MSATVYRITTMQFHLLWILLSGRLLESRGAVFPAWASLGLPDAAVRRAGAALAYGPWEIAPLLSHGHAQVLAEGKGQPHLHGGYRPVACDGVGFFRPRLKGCPTRHYSSQAGKALPAIPFGMVARIGSVGGQRLSLPCRLLRAAPEDPSETARQARALAEAGALLAEDEALILDGGFLLTAVVGARIPRSVVRGAKTFTARRAYLPAEKRRGRPREDGEMVRPLPRTDTGQLLPATKPDREDSFLVDGYRIRVHSLDELVTSGGKPGDPTFTCIVLFDPRYPEPLRLLTHRKVSGEVAEALSRDRWPIEPWPLAGKQRVGAARQFVCGAESRQRLPELALLSGAIWSDVAATAPALPTGFWDWAPKGTPGRLRRALRQVAFAHLAGLPPCLRKKASPTAHLPKGVLGHRWQRRVAPPDEGLRLAP